MNFFRKRSLKKQTQHLLHEARHLRYHREDIEDPVKIEALLTAEANLKERWKARDWEALDGAGEAVQERMRDIAPVRSYAHVRENLEVLAVAISVAMAFRAYFAQPFKIPTGSMQPTLYGITSQAEFKRTIWDRVPLKYVKMAFKGEYISYVYAKATGPVSLSRRTNDNAIQYRIGGKWHKIRPGMQTYVPLNDARRIIEKGTLLAAGKVILGDHIFVNKLKYNFMPPKRGDVIVFKTRGIKHPQIQPDAFYIKRCAGLPGETLRIENKHLVADGEPVESPFPFKRMLTEDGYNGYITPGHPESVRRNITDLVAEPQIETWQPMEDGRIQVGVRIDLPMERVLPSNLAPLCLAPAPGSPFIIDNEDGQFGQADIRYTMLNLDFDCYRDRCILHAQSGYTVNVEIQPTDPFAVIRQADCRFDIYSLFVRLNTSRDAIHLPEDEYLPLGDNTESSLDGRYFGGVERKHLLGPAFVVYWPFNERWGLVK